MSDNSFGSPTFFPVRNIATGFVIGVVYLVHRRGVDLYLNACSRVCIGGSARRYGTFPTASVAVRITEIVPFAGPPFFDVSTRLPLASMLTSRSSLLAAMAVGSSPPIDAVIT